MNKIKHPAIDLIIKSYFQYLTQKDYPSLIQLFAENAVVISPLYGEKLAADFYRELFADTAQSEIILQNIFISSMQTNTAAAHFQYHWTLKNGRLTHFNCVDIFEFTSDYKITRLSIIYDTYQTRSHF